MSETDEIVTRLYRRFKDWSKRGFGPDDVTWCEVKADIEQMLAERILAERLSATERAAKICEEQAVQFLSPQYAYNQPLGSFCERFACDECAAAIRSQP
jgi:hypothetical protein